MRKKLQKSSKKPVKEYLLALGFVALILAIPLVIVTNNKNSSRDASAQLATTPSFSEEFNEPAGTKPSSKWTYNTGKWPNELETYTTNAQNAQMDGQGNLVIKAIPDGNGGYTSARIHTGNSFSQAYGRIEARMKLPPGKGLLPAFWMLGSNFNTVPWPDCGEIDIMEEPGDGAIHMTLHGHGDTSGVGLTGQYNNLDITQWHVYGINWTPLSIAWTIDGNTVQTMNKTQIGSMWSFDNPEFIVLSLAVGGWAGTPPTTTQFPASMYIDYVRAYPLDSTDVTSNGATSTPTPIPTTIPTAVSSDVTPPTVSITYPGNGASFSRGTGLTMTASASDNVGVQRVEFYVNNVLKCTDTTASYSCYWKVPNKRASYSLKAIAYDAAGNRTTSSQITIYSR